MKFRVNIIGLILSIVTNCYRNHLINDGRTDPNYEKASLLLMILMK